MELLRDYHNISVERTLEQAAKALDVQDLDFAADQLAETADLIEMLKEAWDDLNALYLKMSEENDKEN